ncbi:uncharacterized protein F5891DRAFT_1193172 [Suillus fuscotomentosus]|uniref:Ubiquitin-like domain-containing protein n=1 Tax=Suillus fuscotomentosus TaxID=1912939 RepID=A0AAD4E0T0_9AGAM|nr:uncharacterized protein F5891DRAFT_1193172 [Suillus fuscotomentosus]KAG1896374.1 hypothetical protein F5891DRAFT_1193172 [Suillus fuscotomentosus]
MPFPFKLFQAIGKIFAIRLKRPENQGRTQRNSTIADHEGNSSILTDISDPVPAPMHSSNSSPAHPVSAISEPGLEEPPAGFPSAVYPWSASPAREASDIAQVALPLVQAFTGVVPLVGAPINAAIGGLLGVLQVINRCDQNKAALDNLTSRLYRLYYHLCNVPPALDPLEHSRRDLLARKLEDTSVRLKKLQKRRLAYASVTQAITGCSTDIDRYLMECLWSSQMQSQRETHELLILMSRRREEVQHIEQSFAPLSASPLLGSVAPGCVTLVDVTGRHQAISVNWCTSYQQLNHMLRVLFERDAIEAQIQRRYIEEGKYDLCIDEGKQVTLLTSDNWSSIEQGTKIVMRVTIQQDMASLSEVDYQCHFCGAVNRLGARSVKYEYRGRTVCSTECRECKRCFQITRSFPSAGKRSYNSDSNHEVDAETLLVRNFHVQQISVRDLVFGPS